MAIGVHVYGINRHVKKLLSMVIYIYYNGHMRMAASGQKRHGLKLLRVATCIYVSIYEKTIVYFVSITDSISSSRHVIAAHATRQ
jgi:hypothetical protein